MTATQNNKAERFKALHQRPRAFAIPNPWDAGSARFLAGLGFVALATRAVPRPARSAAVTAELNDAMRNG